MKSSSHPALGARRPACFAKRIFADSVVRKAIRRFAFGACRYGLRTVIELEYRFHRLVVQTPGTKVMLRLGTAGRFFYSKGVGAGIGLVQLIALALSVTLFKKSNLVFKLVYASQQRTLALGALRILFLNRDDMSQSDREFHLQFIGGRNDLSFVLQLHGSLVSADGIGDHREDGSDVHMGSPNVEKGGVGASDSTLRGNPTRGGRHA